MNEDLIDDYPSFVKISQGKEDGDIMELPQESDGSLLVSTLQSQFPAGMYSHPQGFPTHCVCVCVSVCICVCVWVGPQYNIFAQMMM